MRFEIDWTGSNNHDTPGCVSVRFQFRGQPSIWRLSASRLSSRNSGFLTGWHSATGGFERYAVKEPESSSRQPRFPVDKPCCFTQLVWHPEAASTRKTLGRVRAQRGQWSRRLCDTPPQYREAPL